jgi:hypothetical protein
MTKRFTDQDIEEEIGRLRTAIQVWAKRIGIWKDCIFKDYLQHVGLEPRKTPVITILVIGDPYFLRFSGEFYEFLGSMGYRCERDQATIEIYPAEDGELAARFLSYFHWRWVCSLIQEDTADVYQELYSSFANNPDQLNRLHWRELEVLLSRIFQSQGFEVELGPGGSDGGVDLRLWSRDPIGDVRLLTVVQAKRYARSNKIPLTQVAALYGIADVEGASEARFVTTSSYLPVARRFATRTRRPLVLADRDDIVAWCGEAANGVIADKSRLVSNESVEKLISEVAHRRDPRLVVAHGRTMIRNDFALVVKETRHAALIMRIRARLVEDHRNGTGTEVPLLDGTTIEHLVRDRVLRAKRTVKDGRVYYWTGRGLYSSWNGKPLPFDRND